jgi:Terminase small subunit
MPELKNPRHERFCLFYLISGNASEAYREAGFRARKNSNVTGPRLLANVGVKARIAELKAQNRPANIKSREDVLQWLSDLMDRPVDEPMKWSDKIRAAEVLNRMCGWNEPDEVRLSAANSLTGYLLELRKESLNAPVLLEDEQKPDNHADNGLNDEGVEDMISASVDAQRLMS